MIGHWKGFFPKLSLDVNSTVMQILPPKSLYTLEMISLGLISMDAHLKFLCPMAKLFSPPRNI